MASASAGSALRNMAKGIKSLTSIYNLDINNRARVTKTATLIINEIGCFQKEVTDIVEAADLKRDSALLTQHQMFIGATKYMLEALKQLNTILTLNESLQQPDKKVKMCVDSLVDGVGTQFNIGFDQAKLSLDRLLLLIQASPRLSNLPKIQRIMENIGKNLAGATNLDGEMEGRLNCLNNLIEEQRSLNAAADEVYNDVNCPREEQEKIQEIRQQINVGTKMWDMVVYFGHVVVFFITLGVKVNQGN